MRFPILLRPWACSLLLCAAAGASAMDIATYEKQRKEPANSPAQARLRSYLLGIGEGLRLANVALQERDGAALFCLPEGTTYGVDDYKRLIDGALDVARSTYVRQEISVETLLLRALQDRHACPAREKPPA